MQSGKAAFFIYLGQLPYHCLVYCALQMLILNVGRLKIRPS